MLLWRILAHSSYCFISLQVLGICSCTALLGFNFSDCCCCMTRFQPLFSSWTDLEQLGTQSSWLTRWLEGVQVLWLQNKAKSGYLPILLDSWHEVFAMLCRDWNWDPVLGKNLFLLVQFLGILSLPLINRTITWFQFLYQKRTLAVQSTALMWIIYLCFIAKKDKSTMVKW